MSMVQQLIAAVAAAEQQIDQQIAQLHSYRAELSQAAVHIQNTLGGSTQSYGEDMIRQLSATGEKVAQSLNRLQLAKEKLQLVKRM